MSKEKLTEIHRWLPCAVFHTVYGLTETCSPATIFPGDASTSSYIGSSGLPIPGTCFCILDDSGSQMQTGQVGEIAVRGTVLLDRYYQKGTGELDGDGWLRTGDLGYFNGEGYLFIVDRKKDMINRGGEKYGALMLKMSCTGWTGLMRRLWWGFPTIYTAKCLWPR
ncbi:MAG: AMP-binding protein [Enterocloster sp.]